jgi:Ion channel
VISRAVAFAVAGLLAVAITGALVYGVARLVTERGVTLRAVLGALTIYLYMGLRFAWAVAFVSAVDSTPYFAQPDVGHGDRVYFSFTVMTTTGFGDYTAATSVGHALAVLEMLLGQLYLVTVIGVLVGGLVGRRRGA